MAALVSNNFTLVGKPKVSKKKVRPSFSCHVAHPVYVEAGGASAILPTLSRFQLCLFQERHYLHQTLTLPPQMHHSCAPALRLWVYGLTDVQEVEIFQSCAVILD